MNPEKRSLMIHRTNMARDAAIRGPALYLHYYPGHVEQNTACFRGLSFQRYRSSAKGQIESNGTRT